MKQLGITFILFFLIHSGFSQISVLDRIITINCDDISVEAALKLLESKNGISFAYNSSLSVLQKKISLHLNNATVREVLNRLCANKNISYILIGNTVTFYQLNTKEPEKYIVSGFVFDQTTGEVLISCSIFDISTRKGAASNNYGFFSLTVPEGQKTIVFSYIGYKTKKIYINSDTLINVKLSPIVSNLHEIIFTQKHREEIINASEMGKIDIRSKQIKNIPSVGGEVDVLKAITLLPGIKTGVDGSAGYYVRGGGASQNLILLDGVPIYNPYHLWGFLSSFNTNAINNISITKSGFPARYGGRLSSVLDITMNEGNNQKWNTDLAVGILSINANVSGPLKKNKSAIMLSARRTYADLFMVPLIALTNSTENTSKYEGYDFTDLNLKVNYKLSEKDRLYVSGFYSWDQYYLTDKATTKWEQTDYEEKLKKKQGWGNIIGSLRWNHLFSNKLFSNTTAYLSYYKFKNKEFYQRTRPDEQDIDDKINESIYFSNIRDIALTEDFQYFPNEKHNIRFGAGYIYHNFKPGVNSFFSQTGKDTISNSIENNLIRASEFSAYFEDDVEIGLRFKLNVGVHSSGFFVGHTNYFSIQPRLSIRYLISKTLSIKAGYAQMTQYLHLLTSSGIVQSSDLWVPSTDIIRPESSKQTSLGIALLTGKDFQLEIDGYYKTMENVIEYKEGASFLHEETGWENIVTSGKGTTYGIEWFLQKKQAPLTGWIGYTLSWANRQFDNLNSGDVFPFRYDRRHDISIVGSYQFSERWSLNSTWVFYTGNAVTVPTTSHIDPYYDGQYHSWYSFPSPNEMTTSLVSSSGIIDDISKRNNLRLPNYHRLDITATYTKKKHWGTWELTFGVTNLYNRMNPSYYTKTYNENPETGQIDIKFKQITLFPIMPSIYYRISF